MLNPETECRRSCRHGVCGEDQRSERGEGRQHADLAWRLLTGLFFWPGLTPELSRAAARLGGVVHVTAQAEPRSGLGSNELLGRASGRFYLTTQTRIPTNLTLARRDTRQDLLPRAPAGEPPETNRRSEQLSRRRLMKSGAPCGMGTEGETRVRRERSGGEHGRDVGFIRSWAMNSHGPA